MFGMGFTEILIIAIIAILFLGPDKLPGAMMDIAKFFRSVKRTVSSAKSTFESELHVSELRSEMESYKKELTSASSELERLSSLDDVTSEITALKKEARIEPEAPKAPSSAPSAPEVVTFKKNPKPSDTPSHEGHN
ncbi:MAG: Sec-independent protein translocase subunit TatB [Campylobacterales bacterium]|nr:Sec-independent protein translocase subunit TatB [Campylobacterales bacterium]